MTRVYLVRHGTTEWNKEEIFRGRLDCKLNETGQAEARALAGYFTEIPLQAIYSSPLSRAMGTAQAVAEAKGLRVIPEPAFIDIDFGEWQGLPLKEVREKYPDLYRLWQEQPRSRPFSRRGEPRPGESPGLGRSAKNPPGQPGKERADLLPSGGHQNSALRGSGSGELPFLADPAGHHGRQLL